MTRVAKTADFSLHVLLPVITGFAIYFLYSKATISNVLLRNYFPDYVWCYSLTNSILIIWKRRVNFNWCIVIVLFSFAIEVLQYLHVINGTADPIDLIIYVLAILTALVTNHFIHKIQIQSS